MSLRPLSLLLLSRSSRSLTSNYVRPIDRGLRTQSTWCRVRARRRLTHSSSVVLKQQENSGTASEGLTLTDSCVKQLLQVTKDEPELVLRVMVDGGGCSGFQYKIEFDKKVNSDDVVFERDGVRVVVDELTLELVYGCTVDYHTELIRAGFRITGNPKAESSCSCGVSFAPK